MTGRVDETFLDLTYGAAIEPGLWNDVITRFADQVGGEGAWLSQLDVEDGGGGAADDPLSRLDPAWTSIYVQHFATRNPLHHVDNPRQYLRGWRPRVLTDEDWMPKADLIRTEFYNDFLRPQGVHSTLMVRIAAVGSVIAVLNITRPEGRGQFDRADIEVAEHLQGHLIRAFDLGTKVSRLRRLNGDMHDILDASPHGLFLVDGDARVRFINRAGERLLRPGDTLGVLLGRLRANSSDATARLHALIARAACPDRELRTGGSMGVAALGRRQPLAVTVAPIRARHASRFDVDHSVIVCVSDLEAGVRLPADRLRALFALTPAETRLAMAMFEGASLADAAETFGVSLNTVRNQLARLFEKTGTTRQSELMSLMMRTVGFDLA